MADDTYMATLERFVVLLYDKTSTQTALTDAQKQLFVKKVRQSDAIPNALFCKRDTSEDKL